MMNRLWVMEAQLDTACRLVGGISNDTAAAVLKTLVDAAHLNLKVILEEIGDEAGPRILTSSQLKDLIVAGRGELI